MITTSDFESALQHNLDPLLGDPIGQCGFRFLPLPHAESAVSLAELGFLGLYPLGKLKNGDWIALFPIHSKPVMDWPALRIGASGGGANTLSTLRGLVRGLLASVEIDAFRWMSISELKLLLPSYHALAQFLGDKRHATEALLRISSAMSRGGGLSKRGSPQENMALASPDSPDADFINALHGIRFHSKDPIQAYTSVLKKHPTHRLTLAAIAKAAKKKNKMSIRNGAMLGLLKGHNGIDNDPAESTPEVLSLSLFNLKQTQKLNKSVYWPLIQRRDNDFGQGFFDIGRALHRGGKPKSALIAYQNAFYWSVSGFGSMQLDALTAALDCAAYLDPDVHRVLKMSAPYKARLLEIRHAETQAKALEEATYWLKYID